MKRIYGIILVLALIPCTVSAKELVVEDNTFKMNIAGENYESDNPILNVNQSTYLPLREVGNLFGKGIVYKDHTIFIETDYPESSGNGHQEDYTIKSSKYPGAKESTAKIIIDGKEYKSNNPVIIVDGTTYLHLREVANIFKETIHFAGNTIYIKGDVPVVEIPENQGQEDHIAFTVNEELILKPDGTLWAWGDNTNGRISSSVKEDNIVRPIKIMDDVVSISSPGLILKKDHTLWEFDPGLRKVMDNVAKVPAGSTYDNARTIITLDGDLYLYGIIRNSDGSISEKIAKHLDTDNNPIPQRGDGYEKFPITPVKVKGISGVKDAIYRIEEEPSFDGYSTYNQGESLLILKQDNSLWACYDYVPVRDSDTDNREPWGHMDSFKHIMDGVTSIESAGLVNAVIKQDNSLWGWGTTHYGGLGRSLIDNVKTPIKMMDDVKSTIISSTFNFAITNKNDLYAWGTSQGPDFYYDGSRKPGMYKIASNIDKIIMGSAFHFVALKTNGTVWMHGWDPVHKMEEKYDADSNLIPEEDRVRIGGFGTGDVREIGYYTMESAEPVKGAIGIGAFVGDRTATFALKPDGSVLVWGPNFIIDDGDDAEGPGRESRIPRVFIR